MDFSWKHMEYGVKELENSRLVWLKKLNRYLQVEEPAYLVFKQFTEGRNAEEISRICEEEYHIPGNEARRFVTEIERSIQNLYQEHQEPENPRLPSETLAPYFHSFRERYIGISGKIFRFSFGDGEMEGYLFPLFSHLETSPDPHNCDLQLEFLRHQGKAYMRINREDVYAWPFDQMHRLKGELSMQMLNAIHEKIRGEWMGVIHAASVSLGRSAVMFPAQSGGGKSTLASLLMAHGCKLLSDDFSPIALKSGQVHSFPGSISLKPGSIPLLSRYFPELMDAGEVLSPSKKVSVRYLKPQQSECQSNIGFQVKSIVFVQYDSRKACELEQISNLSALNDFLKESWLPDDARVSERFLDWFFELPCYRLHYGDNLKAVKTILKLLEDVT